MVLHLYRKRHAFRQDLCHCRAFPVAYEHFSVFSEEPVSSVIVYDQILHGAGHSHLLQSACDVIFELSRLHVEDPYVVSCRAPYDVVCRIIIRGALTAVFRVRNLHSVILVTSARSAVIEIEHRRSLDAHHSVRKHRHVSDIVVRQSAAGVEHAEKICLGFCGIDKRQGRKHPGQQ